MNIGDAGHKAGLLAKTIRYYEDIGLIKPLRDANGYRVFRDKDIHKLAFLSRARGLGFSIEDCRVLMSLYEDQSRASRDVKDLAERHLVEIAKKVKDLRQMAKTLGQLVASCHGDQRPDCPILADLASPTT